MYRMIFMTGVIFILSLAMASKIYALDYDLGNVLVSATKTEQYECEVGSSATVITAAEMEKSGKNSMAEVLQNTPGVSLRRNSVYGGVASLDIRGAKSGQTMIMIDGVEVYDPIAIDRDFDFAHLTTDNIEQVEIIRGPQSALYGANAMAGVVNIITKKGEGPLQIDYSLQAGSFDTFIESLGARGSNESVNYAMFVSRFDSEGVNKARDGGEKDGYKSTTVSTKIGAKVFDEAEVFLAGRYTDAEFDIDEFDNSFQYIEDDPNRVNFSKQLVLKTGFTQWISQAWKHTVSASFINMDRRDRDPQDDTDTTENDDSRFRGDVKKIQWQHDVALSDIDVETLGVEYQQERGASFADTSFYNSQFDRRAVQTRGGYFQAQLNPLENLFATAGVRIDNHDIFGAETTYRIAAAYLSEQTKTRYRTSYGTAFKAPSIYQLYDSTNGNENLQAEKSKGFDAGIEQKFIDDKLTAGITYFVNDFKDIISWTPDFPGAWTGEYTNINKAYTRGCELQTKLKPDENWQLKGNYTYTMTKDKTSGNEFGRRPRHQGSLGLDWDYSPKSSIYVMAKFIGSRFDDDNNTRKLKKYFLFDICASYDVAEDTQFFWRIENLFNRDYELISGFDGLGRAIYTGVKGVF